jgi:hypothetical protein
VGLRGWGPLLGSLVVAGLMVASLTRLEPPCAYVVRQAGASTLATPALIAFVPPEEARPGTALPEPGEPGGTCSSEGVSLPAVRIRISHSIHDTPGAVVEVSALELPLEGEPVTRPGHVIQLESGDLLLVPRTGEP